MIPKHYSLVKEHPQSYEIHDSRDGNRFHIAKQGLNLQMHANLANIPRYNEGSGPISINTGAPQIPESLSNPDPGAQSRQYAMTPATALPQDEDVYGVTPEAIAESRESLSLPDTVKTSLSARSDLMPGAYSPDAFSTQSSEMNSILSDEEAALKKGANAAAVAGNKTAASYQEMNDERDEIPSANDIYRSHQMADQSLRDAYMNKKLDPEHYWANKSTGSKIAAGLGMILGGMGSATAGGPNLAMEVINNAIARDMEAQKNDQSKTFNLWKMNREATKDEQEANLATQNQMLTGVEAKARGFAAQAQGGLASERLAPIIAGIEQQKAANNFRRTLLGATRTGSLIDADPAQLVPSMVPPDQQVKVYDEIGRAQNISNNSSKLLQLFDQAAKENTVARTGAGVVRTPGSVMALHQLMLPNFKSVDGTVRQAAMDESFHNITPTPGDADSKISAKRQALIDWMHSETAAPIAKGSGLDLQAFRSTNAKTAPTPQIQTMNGIKYIKVPGGWKTVE